MPQSVTEPDVDYESQVPVCVCPSAQYAMRAHLTGALHAVACAQLYEIRRLISTTTDPDRRLVLEDQLRELELASLQQDTDDTQLPSARQERRKSFRPNSAKPRSMLTPLTEVRSVR
ncbi:hypothetical protein PINS_up000551 [Pythium insidiosum]|nr:hypothetical protein PINS_up000551 [Pythium insidiosum]